MFYALRIKTPRLASSRARQLQAHFLFLSVCLRLTDDLRACRAATVFLNFCFCVSLSSSNPRCVDTPHLALRHRLITVFTFAIAIAIDDGTNPITACTQAFTPTAIPSRPSSPPLPPFLIFVVSVYSFVSSPTYKHKRKRIRNPKLKRERNYLEPYPKSNPKSVKRRSERSTTEERIEEAFEA